MLNFLLPAIGAGLAYSSSRNTAKAAESASNAQLIGTEKGVAEQRRQFDISRTDAQPYMDAGKRALDQRQALLGLSGTDAQQQAINAFQESPSQKFLRERAERSLIRNASATGNLGGGNIQQAVQEQAIGVAAGQLGDYQNQLAALSGGGQTASNNMALLGGQTANNISNAYMAGGRPQASGIIGANQARQAGNQQLYGVLNQGMQHMGNNSALVNLL